MVRDYGDCKFGSVTAILGILRKLGLEWWFKTNTSQLCDEISAKSKAIGITIHSIIQAHIEETEFEVNTDYPMEVQNAVKSFFRFKKDHLEIKLQKAEMQVVSQKHKYCGTLDCIATENGELLLLDWKSSDCKVGTPKEVEVPTIYPEAEYQAVAYAKAYNEQEGKQIKKVGVVAIAKDKVAYNYLTLSEAKMNEIFDRVFIPCISIFYYQRENDKYVSKENNSYGKYPERSRVGSFGKGSGRPGTKGAKLPSNF